LYHTVSLQSEDRSRKVLRNIGFLHHFTLKLQVVWFSEALVSCKITSSQRHVPRMGFERRPRLLGPWQQTGLHDTGRLKSDCEQHSYCPGTERRLFCFITLAFPLLCILVPLLAFCLYLHILLFILLCLLLLLQCYESQNCAFCV